MIRFLQKSGQTTKYILGAMLLLICASMVITLIPGGLGSDVLGGGTAKGVIAKVDGQEISTDEVRTTAKQMLQQQSPQAASNPIALAYFSTMALDQLVKRQAMISEANRMGLRVNKNEVLDELQHGRYAATFFPGGSFIGKEEYEAMLQQHNLTTTVFEDSVAKEILLTKLQALISGTASVSESEIHDLFIKQNTKVKFDYAVLREEDIKKSLHPTDTELKAFYQSHLATYTNSIPEKRKVKYAVIDTNKVEDGTQVTPEDLHNYYQQHREEYRVPEQAKVSHILIKTPAPGPDGKVDEKGMAESHRRAEDLLKQIKSGASFEDLAKKYSEDPGSAKQGGSLGWMGKGQTVPEFDKAIFSNPKGLIPDLVRSAAFGFHIIRIEDKQDAHLKSLDEIKAQIEPGLKHQKAVQIVQQEAEALLKDARSPQGLDAAAAKHNVPVITSDFFSRRDMLPGLGPSPQFMDAVFAAQEKSPPDIASATQGTVVFELLAVKPPSTPTFDEIRTKAEEEFKNEQARTLLTKKVEELSDRAKQAHDLKKGAKELGATMKTSDLVLPDGQVPDVGSMSGQASVAFTMKAGEISGPISSGNDAAVLQILENQQPTDADYAAKRDQIRDGVLLQKQQERFELFVSNLVDEMTKSGKIKKNQEELKTLTRAASESGM